jgi:hypothetical protein
MNNLNLVKKLNKFKEEVYQFCSHLQEELPKMSYIKNDVEDFMEERAPVLGEHIQGFLTNQNRFVDREEGGKIAFEAKQTKELKEHLFSEDLY